MAKKSEVVVIDTNALTTLTDRITAMREELQERHAENLRRARQGIDDRLVEVVAHRAHQTIDALLLTN